MELLIHCKMVRNASKLIKCFSLPWRRVLPWTRISHNHKASVWLDITRWSPLPLLHLRQNHKRMSNLCTLRQNEPGRFGVKHYGSQFHTSLPSPPDKILNLCFYYCPLCFWSHFCVFNNTRLAYKCHKASGSCLILSDQNLVLIE